eukprot:CAMPEP_0183376860 /NCGR_PEP_ID=MMETSP0164_2-20130417/121489_1 /TAXON_ID=221442 /ORGANISM="Coccolithus pelagicus ssp braarudi, Strain PLY182g" /LENGTH=139 /DNA_ID=CAMNT_0025554247 /DNA_START=129 /DNA_END=548 /DNA_ORIENTATION=-
MHRQTRAHAAFGGNSAACELRCPVCRGAVGLPLSDNCHTSAAMSNSAPMTWIPRERKRPRLEQILQARKAIAMWRGLEKEILRTCDESEGAARTAEILLGIIHRWAVEEEWKLAALEKHLTPISQPMCDQHVSAAVTLT